MRSRLVTIVLLCFVGIAGCGLVKPRAELVPEMLLLSPQLSEKVGTFKHKMKMVTAQKQQHFIVLTKYQSHGLKIMIMLPTGQPIMQLEYDGISVTEKNYTAVALPAKEIIAIMQLAVWPDTVVAEAYHDAHWSFEAQLNERKVFFDGKPQVTVEYKANELIEINHLTKHYRIDIQPL